ncbi:TolC family protein [Novosphingobium mathurense]|uniref:Outer membrane protein, cobalt-zinc-cadmium efflux system n=1 Tax=Novosphingobium mathurense TaxID=428990 RepID=A0A1U6GZB1_9SPHN|nr:TolC family protein [Novosphingobium mathurense]SLJ88861.1 outer membrane protein, cobalt-zinc-cadmium efflux system [Novosphingobium mathurense]
MFSYPSARLAVRLIRLAPPCAVIPLVLSAQAASAQGLTLSEALSRVATTNPALQVNAARLEAADAAVAIAGVRPRDTVGVEVEDFAGTGTYGPLEQQQTTAWYERTWERGGKREARLNSARAELGVAGERNALRMLDMLAQVQAAWVDALAAEAGIAIAQQRLQVAEQTRAQVDRRVARALDPLFAAERAKTAVIEARIALDQARRQARLSRANLSGWWDGGEDFALETEPFFSVQETAPSADESPDLALLSAERQAADTQVRLAETGDAGNATARIGIRHFGQGNNVALMVGGSIPLGNRSANRGNVARAAAESRAAEAEIAVARLQVGREVDRLVAQRAALASEIARIEREVLPSAQKALALVRDGFARGGTAFTFLEINQAQQALIDGRSRRVDLLRQFHLAGARLDRLTGRHASLVSSTEIR